MRSLPIIFLVVLTSFFLLKAEEKPENGVFHLHVKDLEKNNSRFLQGKWNFYWQTTYSQFQVKKKDLLAKSVPVPGNWGMLGYPRHGYGTYVLKIVLDGTYTGDLGLRIPSVGNAYRAYVNGSLVAKAGIFSTDKATGSPEYLPQEIYFPTLGDTVEIAIEVSNFHYREGGLTYTPSIGKANAIKSESQRSLITNSVIIGLFTMVVIYFLSLYLANLNDRKAFYFALLCLSASLRQASVNDEIVLKQFFNSIPWEWLVRCEYISLFGIMYFSVMYFSHLFELERTEKINGFLGLVCGLLSFFVLFTPASISSFIIPPFLLFSLVCLCYLLFISIRAVVLNRKFSAWFLLGYGVIFLCGINDILYSQEIIRSVYLLPTSIIGFVFVNVVILTLIFSDSFHQTESLTYQLEEANKNHKNVIYERTIKLSEKSFELEKTNEVKDKIFSIIAHDLRSPIKTLSAFLSIAALDNNLTVHELKTHLKKIQRDTESLNLTLDNLLMWSRSQIKGVTTHQSDLDVALLINHNLDLYRLSAENKEVRIKSTVPEGLYLHADKDHISLVLRNIIGNALKFTHPGGQITISSRIHDHFVQILVQDTGIGIPEEQLAKMFQLNNHYTTYGTTNEKGTGLGLMLCQEYITKNNGMISIRSEVGKGTEVCIEIPATRELFDE
jgi:signal transduction histidine kinase